MTSLSDQEFLRYNRHIMLEKIGEPGQLKFRDAHILIVGMGGLGCPAAQYLSASGVGQLTLVDNDVVEISNLQRQVLYTEQDIGRPKVRVAKAQLHRQNPLVTINAVNSAIQEIDFAKTLKSVDVVLDCTDTAETRHFINDQCYQAKVKLVSAAAIQGQGQLLSFDFNEPGSPCYRCLFPNAQETPLNCQTAGVFSPVLGVLGSLQATEALRLLMGESNNLNKLTLFDAWDMAFRQFGVSKSDECAVCELTK